MTETASMDWLDNPNTTAAVTEIGFLNLLLGDGGPRVHLVVIETGWDDPNQQQASWDDQQESGRRSRQRTYTGPLTHQLLANGITTDLELFAVAVDNGDYRNPTADECDERFCNYPELWASLPGLLRARISELGSMLQMLVIS